MVSYRSYVSTWLALSVFITAFSAEGCFSAPIPTSSGHFSKQGTVGTSAIQAPSSSASIAPQEVYAAAASRVRGYMVGSDGRASTLCTKYIDQDAFLQNVAVDRKGNLLVPLDQLGNSVAVYQGPRMCGRLLGEVMSGEDGYAVDAASINVTTGKIVIAAAPPFSLTGGVEVCRLGGNCSQLHTQQYSFGAEAVAIDGVGDCWALVETNSNFVLDYFKRCAQTGVPVAGWVNPSGGGLDVDTRGDLISIASGRPSNLYVYEGCKPNCTLVGGPFRLAHEAFYGHISHDGTLFASVGGDHVDVYSYQTDRVARLFGFETGIGVAVGVAFNPGH